jgi:tetratricopeptide (TPR) repeat protein
MEEDRQLHNMIKKFIYVISFCLLTQVSFAASSGGGSGASSSSSSSSDSDNYLDQFKSAQKLVKRGKKLELKGKNELAIKRYNAAYKHLLKAHKLESTNPDILNYLGFTSRKAGKYERAEKYYLQGLKINPNHNGINEYLGELYVKTQRIDLAKERLAVLKDCNCEEYEELKEVINNN